MGKTTKDNRKISIDEKEIIREFLSKGADVKVVASSVGVGTMQVAGIKAAMVRKETINN